MSDLVLPVAPPNASVKRPPPLSHDLPPTRNLGQAATPFSTRSADESSTRSTHPIPDPSFQSAAAAQGDRQFVLVPFGTRSPGSALIDERASAPPFVLPAKQSPSRLRTILGFFHNSSDANECDALPRYRSTLPVPTPPPSTPSNLEKLADDALRIWTKEHVVAQVQLPV